MKVLDVRIPEIEDIKNIPAFKRQSGCNYFIGSKAILNPSYYSYVTENGLISTVGKKYNAGDDIRLEIILEPENDDEINKGTIIEYNGILFEIIDDNKAISLENIFINNIFKPIYTVYDPNIGDNFFVGYKINNAALDEWNNKTLNKIDIDIYNEKEHSKVEKELFKNVIIYYYSTKKEYENRAYSNEDKAGIYDLSNEKILKELETPNAFVSDIIKFFISAINYKLSIEQCALYTLKGYRKLLSFDDKLDNLSQDKKEILEDEIKNIRVIYNIALKYVNLNNEYSVYLDEALSKKSNKTY